MSIKSVQCLLSYLSGFMTSVQCMASHGLYPKDIPAEIHNKTQKRYVKKHKTSMQQYLLPHDVYATVWYLHTSSVLDVNCSHRHRDGDMKGARLSQRGRMRESTKGLA